MSAVIIENTTFYLNNLTKYLINASQASVYLNGPVLFSGINSTQGIIAVISHSMEIKSILTWQGNIDILNNTVNQFVHFTGKGYDHSITIKEDSNILIKSNNFKFAFAACEFTSDAYTPRPLCFFQFYSNVDQVFYTDELRYSINFENNIMHYIVICGNSEYTRFTHCSWLPGAIFQEIMPLVVNKQIVKFKGNIHKQWIIGRKSICICQNDSHYNCRIDQLGPIYPGEILLLKLYKRSSDQYLYDQFYKFYRRTLLTLCETSESTDVELTYEQCVEVNFTVCSNHSSWCELFIITNPIHSRFETEYFYVMLLPGCPKGFIKYTNKCQCDRILEFIGVFTCDINHRTILRPANSWITATTNNYSHNYIISHKCPFDYCLPHTSHLDLSNPNS